MECQRWRALYVVQLAEIRKLLRTSNRDRELQLFNPLKDGPVFRNSGKFESELVIVAPLAASV
jgi:hypothetical protein